MVAPSDTQDDGMASVWASDICASNCCGACITSHVFLYTAGEHFCKANAHSIVEDKE
jgi:hypothetical protein